MKKISLALLSVVAFLFPVIAAASATTTYGNGINLTTGCITYNGGSCITSGGGGSVTSVTGTWPVISSGGATPAISWGGISTTSNLSTSNLLYATGVNTFAGVATSSMSPNSTLTAASGSFGSQIGGSNLTFGINLANSNWWTAKQNFTNASTSLFQATSTTWLATSGGYVNIGTTTCAQLMCSEGSFPQFRLLNTNTAQFAGSEFFLGNDISSLGNQAGVVFYSGINDGSATQGYFAIQTANSSGAAANNIFQSDFNANTTSLYAGNSGTNTFQISASNATTTGNAYVSGHLWIGLQSGSATLESNGAIQWDAGGFKKGQFTTVNGGGEIQLYDTNTIQQALFFPTGTSYNKGAFLIGTSSTANAGLAWFYVVATTSRPLTEALATVATTTGAKLWSINGSGLILQGGIVPTVATSSGSGTGSVPVTITGNANDFNFNITTGTSPGTSATIATITMPTACPTATIPVLSPANSNTDALAVAAVVYASSTGASTFVMVSGATGLAGATNYIWNFHVGCY